MKFRKKPVVIEAEQYRIGEFPKGVCNGCHMLSGPPHVHTMHNNQAVILKDGDWVMPEPDGEHFYPCDAKVFAATYTADEPAKPFAWLKISSENRSSGGWFFDLEHAKRNARRWEMLVPIYLPDWPNVQDDADHLQDGDLATSQAAADKAYLAKPLPLMPGIAAFLAERLRQQSVEGYDAKHDDEQRTGGELTCAALSYADAAMRQIRHGVKGSLSQTSDWPWSVQWWKPSADAKRNLGKAGALLAAEYDRLCRLEQPPATTRQFAPPPPDTSPQNVGGSPDAVRGSGGTAAPVEQL